MQNQRVYDASTGIESVVSTNKVLKNTYMLLGATLLFSAACAGVTRVVGYPPLPWFVSLALMFGLLYLVNATANSAWGLLNSLGLARLSLKQDDLLAAAIKETGLDDLF